MPNAARESRSVRLYHLKIVSHGWYGRVFHSERFHRLVDRLSKAAAVSP